MGPILRLELDTGESRRIASGTLSIGRGAGNEWVLPAAEGPSVSRRHCSFSAGPEGFSVTDLGSTNGTRLNGRPLPPHAPAPLATGDVVEVGPFRLTLTIDSNGEDPAPLEAVSRDPFDEALASPPSVPPPSAAVATGKRPQPPSLEDLLGAADSGEAAPQGLRLGTQPGIDKDPLAQFLNKLEPLSRSSPAEAEPRVASPPQFEALLSAAPAPRAKGRARSGPNDNPFVIAPRNRPGAPAGPTPVARTGPSSDGTTSDVDSLVAAFLEGAGLDTQSVSVDDARGFLHNAGAAFARMAEGLRELLAVRALIKEHARLNQTQIRALDNNPLKFSADGREATQALLQPRGRGYMPASTAVETACRDLMAHELALLEGIQAAIGKLLQSFNPAKLEALLADAGSLGLLLQGGRHAKLWELYGERYAEIAAAARARFMGDVNDAFRAAYERKIAEFAAGPKRPAQGEPE
jgi:type VI secretion system FHA domain protein